MLYLAWGKSTATIMCFSFCACCLRRWPNSLRWVFECKTHAYRTGAGGKKKKKKKSKQACQPAIRPSRCFPDHWRNCTHSQSNHALIWWYLHTVITEPWNQIMCRGYRIRHAIVLALSVAGGEPAAEAGDLTLCESAESQVRLWRAQTY